MTEAISIKRKRKKKHDYGNVSDCIVSHGIYDVNVHGDYKQQQNQNQ